MSTCCKDETDAACCGGTDGTKAHEPAAAVAQTPTQKNEGCCGGAGRAAH